MMASTIVMFMQYKSNCIHIGTVLAFFTVLNSDKIYEQAL